MTCRVRPESTGFSMTIRTSLNARGAPPPLALASPLRARRGPQALLKCAVVTAVAVLAFTAGGPAHAQPSPQGTPGAAAATAPEGIGEILRRAAVRDEPATLTYQNRAIVTLRARVLTRTAAERADSAVRLLDRLVDEGLATSPATVRDVDGVATVMIGRHVVFAVLPEDVDELSGETPQQTAADAVARLDRAVAEALELRTPRRLVAAAARSLAGSALYLLLLWGVWRLHRNLVERLPRTAEERLGRLAKGDAQLVRASHAPEYLRRLVTLAAVVGGVVLTYWWLFFVLRQFPYTRPWGEAMRGYLLGQIGSAGLAIAHAIPDLFTILLIVIVIRFLARLANLLFEAVEHGRFQVPWIYPETVNPTRRLTVALLWLFGLILAYPYLPGSQSEAFKGVSVFIGLIISLGSSGIVNQLMSGFTITYSRALRVGDFVRVGEVEGRVLQVGALSTKIKTPRREDVTIPNAVVVSQVTTNFSRYADTEGVFVPTSVTIGYDAPWRQVRALLLLAAARTSGVRREPAPNVLQTALQDFYVQYTLLVSLEDPSRRLVTLNALHENIQDAFNEHGVQIMSPNYEADPNAPKIVPKEKWFAAPASAAAPSDAQPPAPTAVGT
jgi:small-conductance mechanosensitive channel